MIGPGERDRRRSLAADAPSRSSSARRSRSSPRRRSIRRARRSRCSRPRSTRCRSRSTSTRACARSASPTSRPSTCAGSRTRSSPARSASSSRSRPPFHIQTPLEPHAAVADWQEDELTVWSSTQGIFAGARRARGALRAPAVQRPRDRRVRRRRLRQQDRGRHRGDARGRALAPRAAAGQPGASPATRSSSPAATARRRARRSAWRPTATARSSPRSSTAVIGMGSPRAAWCRLVHGPAMSAYASANAHAMRFPVKLNLRPVNAFRAPGLRRGHDRPTSRRSTSSPRALELDPLELRRRAHVDHDQGTRPAVLVEVAARLLRPRRRALGLGRPRRAARRDAAPTGCCAGSAARRRCGSARRRPAGECTIRIGADGIATVVTGIQDIGTGTLTRRADRRRRGARPAARPGARRRRRHAARTCSAPTSGGSVTTASVTPAVRAAAASVRRALLELAGEHLRDLARRPRAARRADPLARQRARLRLHRAHRRRSAQASVEGAGARTLNSDEFSIQTWGCQVAQVAVDPGLGTVIVEHDLGGARRRAHHQPAARVEPGRGRHPPGRRLRADRGARGRPDDGRADQRDARRLQGADDRRHAGDHRRVHRPPRPGRRQHRREGARRAADHPDRRGDRQRVRARHRPALRARCR